MNDQTYWANLEPHAIGDVLCEKIAAYYLELERSGRWALLQRAYRAYFSLNSQGRYDATRIQRAGDQQELSVLRAAHYRNLLQHLHVLTTQQRPVFEARATNKDVRSKMQAVFAPNVLEHYMREERHELLYRDGAEFMIALSEAYLEETWDDMAGDVAAVDPDTGAGIPAGNVRANIYGPLHVVRQIYAVNDRRLPWYIPWRWENKYELAAKYPDKAQAILAYSGDVIDRRYLYYSPMEVNAEADEDMVPVFTLWHDRTPACPTGRKCVFLGADADLMLEYAELGKYLDMPFYPAIPMRQHGTSFGYSVAFDLLCIQEAIDLLYSTILSNQAAFGVQNVWMPPGANISPVQLAGGLNLIQSQVKPEAINLTQTPAEIFKFLQSLEQLAEIISGVNSVARGQPDSKDMSGAALALIASQAVQFANGLQAAYVRLLEDGGTGVIRILQRFASLPRLTVIAGKDSKSYVKEFTGADLDSVGRIIVDVGNPVSRTVAGRIQMAQDLLQAQVIKDPTDYIQVIETGTVNPMIDDTLKEKFLIESENEALRDGSPVLVTAVDQHLEHIKAHAGVLADNDDRQDPALLQRVLGHINEHIQNLKTLPPEFLNALGQSPMQPDQPPQGANAPQPNATDAPPPDGAPQQPDTAPPGQQVASPEGTPPAMASAMPRMPKAPNNAPPTAA